MQEYYNSQYYHWDLGAEACYLSIPNSNPADSYFISHDDSNSIAAKLAYIQKNKLSGFMIYELGMGYPCGGAYPLLTSLKVDVAELTSGATNLLPHLVWPLNGAINVSSPVSLDGYPCSLFCLMKFRYLKTSGFHQW